MLTSNAQNQDEAVERIALLSSALHCGGLYALWLMALSIFFPFLSGMLWQNMIGPVIVRQHPWLTQSDDFSRPSYFPLKPEQGAVMPWELWSFSLDDLTHAMRDGMVLGVVHALLPEILQPAFLTAILGIVIAKNLLQISYSYGAAKTDRVIWAARDLLMYVGSMAALKFSYLN